MKIIIRCPCCRRDVAIDRDDQLPLPAPDPPAPPDYEAIKLQHQVQRLHKMLSERNETIRKLHSENDGLRANIFDRHATPAEKWMLLSKQRQSEINRLKTRISDLQTTLNNIMPQAAAKFFKAQESSEGYLVLNGSAASAFPDVQY